MLTKQKRAFQAHEAHKHISGVGCRVLVCIQIGTLLRTRPGEFYFIFKAHARARCSTNRRRVSKVCSPLESPVKAASTHPLAFVLLLHMASEDQRPNPRTNARMGRVDRNWTKSGGRLSPMARGFVSG